jgi:hypothetical protein
LGITANVTLNMSQAGQGIYIYPVEEFITKSDRESSYVDLLKKTKGSWGNEPEDKIDQKRHELEVKASDSRKNSW